MKRILIRIFESFLGMIAYLVFIHLLCLCLGIIVSFFIWENPIDTLTRGYYRLWEPINEGWNISNRIAFILWFLIGVLVTSIDNTNSKP